ncbi:hypothetical protein [Metasolibacillus meyeri]|uniref:hypothetical protein n=1 Tax=Metasolibacillus meyeri TaxID=1071052 RepID=UPI000D327985|nr:hypothetical protein [Metasolibacillus meyeri]
MTLDEYRAELAHLQQMYSNTNCKRCRIRLLDRIYVTREAIIDHYRHDALIESLEQRGVAAKVVKRFKIEKSIGPNGEAVKAVVKVDA